MSWPPHCFRRSVPWPPAPGAHRLGVTPTWGSVWRTIPQARSVVPLPEPCFGATIPCTGSCVRDSAGTAASRSGKPQRRVPGDTLPSGPGPPPQDLLKNTLSVVDGVGHVPAVVIGTADTRDITVLGQMLGTPPWAASPANPAGMCGTRRQWPRQMADRTILPRQGKYQPITCLGQSRCPRRAPLRWVVERALLPAPAPTTTPPPGGPPPGPPEPGLLPTAPFVPIGALASGDPRRHRCGLPGATGAGRTCFGLVCRRRHGDETGQLSVEFFTDMLAHSSALSGEKPGLVRGDSFSSGARTRLRIAPDVTLVRNSTAPQSNSSTTGSSSYRHIPPLETATVQSSGRGEFRTQNRQALSDLAQGMRPPGSGWMGCLTSSGCRSRQSDNSSTSVVNCLK
ncbi:hypothetical protein Amir_4580 [Actinosynnema mirum DSM 43827]|uniref:Uncharacterized protein n=1 Tax=Actinosynnema mirum (strain ATCC 29888 / DSM 43827 / JCM 3225 / NBRC 14064 / NCIMB 13271 / NRRL B-12336 / IMRU 3971 / 101) TaxID=446462 RepID=C6WLM3_ACTMD|nr:hypothetical protein Amir_4580 [Actinosynnema mirum DSM 43827]